MQRAVFTVVYCSMHLGTTGSVIDRRRQNDPRDTPSRDEAEARLPVAA